MIRFRPGTCLQTRWIGVDLNTTGHPVVVADPRSRKIITLGKRALPRRISSKKNCTKLYRENRLWKLRRMKSREKKEFRSLLNRIAWQIIGFAESAGAGIKFEKLFTAPNLKDRIPGDSCEFSFENGSFAALLRLVERRAEKRGIPVVYVNPAHTSKTCSRCGCRGNRMSKRFECPQCGLVIHADVNAALNIATAPNLTGKCENNRPVSQRKRLRRLEHPIRAGGKSLVGTDDAVLRIEIPAMVNSDW